MVNQLELAAPPIEFPLTAGQRIAARRTVCSFAVDAADAAEIMRALGIHPSQDAEAGVEDQRVASVPGLDRSTTTWNPRRRD